MPILSAPSFSYRTTSALPTLGNISVHKKFIIRYCSSCHLKDQREQNGNEENLKRRQLLVFLVSSGLFQTLPSAAKTKIKNPYDERRLLEQNRRIQKDNNAPEDFPSFVREGFQVKVLASENYTTRSSGLILRDFEVGEGDCPKTGQQVTFHYIGYNESGRRIDSSYLQGVPAKIRMGTNALVPGFEEGISDMKPGGKRRIIIPPELGPPVSSVFLNGYMFCFLIFSLKFGSVCSTSLHCFLRFPTIYFVLPLGNGINLCVFCSTYYSTWKWDQSSVSSLPGQN